ncbi:hypothetical protein BXT89_14305 [Halopseudomonas pachastrellae]|uniref:Phage recombination protein Bet n=1 Tax=Halopseudomonas pachastrellae TaxID=254161 RepID=A0A1S8DER4_9GAMM|nr:hypothetical protein [Halopseudomonas pachastrellae]ONM43122.1 hypothetical protein BXT89_14305 [Halopseudomonas pachastrellae]SFL70860.1 hypothetical protein SAMN05216256_10181 [Halopseudomonas pachastrellae]
MGQEIAVVAQRETAGLVASEAHRFSVVEIRQRVNLVQEVMQNIMKRDTHYGTIPGTPKPTLYKPGAEVLCVTFRIAQEYRIEDLSSDGNARYRVTCIGRHQTTGITLGEGVGECSSGEEKYKWRSAACKAELDYTPENMRRKKFYKNGNSVDQIRTEPADLANTILKMACKRAMIAMTLNVTAASDIFTQDIEDIPEELRTEEASQPATNPELTAKWVTMANGATNPEALTEIWQAGVKELQDAKDMTAYNAFKAAVAARGEALKKEQQPAPEQQPAFDDDDVPFE